MSEDVLGEAGDPIHDFIILGMPADVDPDAPEVRQKLNDQAHRNIYGQYRKQRPKALIVDPVHWVITSDWRDVEKFQPGDGCPTCIAGNDQAVAYLKEHPERRLALGNLTYWEVW